ncbi:MAG: Rrf2 family transcriptional regulator [Arenibacterium sp.]
MRITKRTNIAMRLLMFCAAHPDDLVTKKDIAARCNLSENHLAQVVNQLAHLGFLNTQRGRNGGIRLGRSPQRILVGDVFRQIEGQHSQAECFADVDNTCPFVDCCRLRDALGQAAEAFYAHLDTTRLSDLICGNGVLIDMLTGRKCSKNQPVAELA